LEPRPARGKKGARAQDDDALIGELAGRIAALAAEEARRLARAALQQWDEGCDGLAGPWEEDARQTGTVIGRALLQGVVDIAAARPEGKALCPAGHPARAAGRRPKTIRTLVGPVATLRPWHHCQACRHGFAPFDARLGVVSGSLSPGLVQTAALAGMEMPFGKADRFVGLISGARLASAKTIDRATKTEGGKARRAIDAEAARAKASPELAWDPDKPGKAYIVIDGTGAPMVPKETAGRDGKQPDGKAKTREVKIACLFTQSGLDPATGEPVQDPGSATYLATFEPCDPFAAQTRQEFYRRGLDTVVQPVVLGDGAKWIWRIADEKFPQATQIVDYYHACEHVHDLSRALKRVLDDPKQWADHLIERLDQGDTDAIARAVEALDLPARAPDLIPDAEREVGYFAYNHQRMQYAHFKKKGYFIGSGAVESACNTVVAQRAKQAGMHWTIKGLDPIIALRVLHLSGRTGLIWNTITDQTPAPKPQC